MKRSFLNKFFVLFALVAVLTASIPTVNADANIDNGIMPCFDQEWQVGND